MPDESLLDMALFVYVQMKINGGGLKIFVAQMVFDVGDGVATVKQIHCPAVTKTMHGIDILKSFWRENLFEILPANSVNAVPC